MRKKITLLFASLLAFVGVAKADVVSELQNKSVEVGAAATEVMAGQWYILNNVGRNAYVSQEDNDLKMRATNSVANGDNAETKAGYLFKITDAGEGKYNVMSGNGKYFALGKNTATVSDTPVNFEIALIGTSADNFYLYDVDNNYAADGQEVGYRFVGWSESVPANVGGNDSYCLLPVSFEESSFVDVVYNYFLDGKSVYSEKVESVLVGSAYAAPAIDFLTFTYPDSEGVKDTTTEVKVTCTSSIPFAVTADINNPVWQVVEMHRYGERFLVWEYESENDGIILRDHKDDKLATIADNMLWCFVGNLFDGFSIYNKAAGFEKALVATADSASVGVPVDGNNVFKAVESTYTKEPTACFTNDGKMYINHNGGRMKYWTDADNGSTCYFYTPANLVLAQSPLKQSMDAPVGAVGTYIVSAEDQQAFDEAYAAADANGAGVVKASQDLASVVGVIENSEKVAFVAGDYYIKAAGVGNNADWYVTFDADNNFKAAALAEEDELGVDYVWSFKAVEGGYTIHNALDVYVDTLTAAPAGTKLSSEKVGTFTLTESGLAKFIIKDSHDKVLRTENNGVINEWSGEVNEAWYLIPVVEAGDNDQTGIENIGAWASAVIYDLTGRRVEKMEKGLYIVNGKKVLAK